MVIDGAAADGGDLQLSGHTHGGQIWPFHHLVRVPGSRQMTKYAQRGAPTPWAARPLRCAAG
ncbi:hypothetical protein [Streptomyces sp. NPDC058463]|uniref:hypothetical protein n=1 Tax=Streptomyces sp. NPDC058463 TaxID=3346510 RepID=UPI00364A7B80